MRITDVVVHVRSLNIRGVIYDEFYQNECIDTGALVLRIIADYSISEPEKIAIIEAGVMAWYEQYKTYDRKPIRIRRK